MVLQKKRKDISTEYKIGNESNDETKIDIPIVLDTKVNRDTLVNDVGTTTTRSGSVVEKKVIWTEARPLQKDPHSLGTSIE